MTVVHLRIACCVLNDCAFVTIKGLSKQGMNPAWDEAV